MKYLFQIICIVVVLFVIQSCDKNQELIPEVKYNMIVLLENEQVEIKSDQDVDNFFKKELEITNESIQDISLETAEDVNGKYYAIRGVFQKEGGLYVTATIPLTIKQKKAEDDDIIYVNANCTMTCTSENCNGCEQIIHEKCARQTCRCSNAESGGCTSTMSF